MNHFDPDLGLGNVTVKCNFNDSMVAVIEFRPLGHQAHSLPFSNWLNSNY